MKLSKKLEKEKKEKIMNKEPFESDLCRTSARLFKYAAEHNYDMEDFAKFYMNHEFTNLELDGDYTPFAASFARELLEILEYPEQKGEVLADPDVASWIGYMYRLIQIRKGVHSKDVYANLPYSKMELLWVGGHTIADEMFIEDLPEL